MKRRNFLALAGGALVASTGLSAINLDQLYDPNKKAKKVIIIGAGIAGLSAAAYLKQKQVEVIVLESSKRIGGRIYSYQLPEAPELTVEFGAEWVGSSHTALIQLCKASNLTLNSHTFIENQLISDVFKKPYNSDNPEGWKVPDDWQNKFKKILNSVKTLSQSARKPLDKLSYYQYLLNEDCPENELLHRDLLDSTDFGESIRFVSALAALEEYADSSPQNEMDYHVQGGNQLLIETLANQIGMNNIKTEHPVVSITQSRKGVSVQCAQGQKFEADRIICALPTQSVLKINWQPALPTLQLQAIQSLNYSRIVKTSVLFKERFWKDENFAVITDTLAQYIFHTTQNQPGPKGVLVSYATGDRAAAIAQLTKSQRIATICQALKPIFGDISALVENQYMFYWGNHPATRGAYALFGINQWNELQTLIGKPFANTVFAGEHLAEWQGFMEGAFVTGKQAAALLV